MSKCNHNHHGRDCPFAGTFADPGGDTTPWWCRWHYDPRNRGHGIAQDEFYRVASTPAGYQAQMREWYPNGPSGAAQAVDERMAQHPEWRRQPGEGQSEYVARMMPACKTMADEITAKSNRDAGVSE